MIKHSFIRSSKLPRPTYTTSHQVSPSKQYLHSDPPYNPRLRQSLDFSNRHPNTNQKFLKHLIQDSIQQSKIRSFDMNSVYRENEINGIKHKMIELEMKVNAALGMKERLEMVEERLCEWQMGERNEESRIGERGGGQKRFQIMDSEVEEEELSLASIKESLNETFSPNQIFLTKKQFQEYVNLQPSSLQLQTTSKNILKLQSQIKQIKQREIHLLELLQKSHQQNSKTLSHLSQTLRKQLSQNLKYQITKNNQLFFKLKSNQKTLSHTLNEKMQFQLKHINKSIEGIKSELMEKVNQFNRREFEQFQGEVESVIENVLEEVNANIEQVKGEGAELAKISEAMMGIVKSLVKKSGGREREHGKSVDIIEIIKSNIVEINSLKVEQGIMSKELMSMKPPLSLERGRWRNGGVGGSRGKGKEQDEGREKEGM